MIGVDTNVLVRFLVQDDVVQGSLAKEFFASLSTEEQGYIGSTTMIETVWVLQKCYQTPHAVIAKSMEALLDSQELAFQDSPSIYQALQAYKKGTDFADALIVCAAKQAGCKTTVSFDKKAATKLGMKLLS